MGEAGARVQGLRAPERPEREVAEDHRRRGRGRLCVLVRRRTACFLVWAVGGRYSQCSLLYRRIHGDGIMG